jgi:hypothetical protein
VGLKSLKSPNLTNGYPNKNKKKKKNNNNNNNKVKSKPLELRSRVKITNESKVAQNIYFLIFEGRSARHCIRLFQKSDRNPQCWTSHFDFFFENVVSGNLQSRSASIQNLNYPASPKVYNIEF